MRASTKNSMLLEDGAEVAVVGGGPAGSFFTVRLLREARRLGRDLRVRIIEKKRGTPGLAEPLWNITGCNFCAGGISPRLDEALEREGIRVPPHVVQEEIHRIWIHGFWKNFPLKVPEGGRMYTVLRGSLPVGVSESGEGFDGFLLGCALREGGALVHGEAVELIRRGDGRMALAVRKSAGSVECMEADFVVLATGVNARWDRRLEEPPLLRSFRTLNPGFVPPRVRKTLIFEVRAGRDYLHRHLNHEAVFMECGGADLRLEHTALVPKGEVLTVVLIGRSVDEASLPDEARSLIDRALALPHVRRILPGIEKFPVACACTPRLSIRPARNPCADRLAVVGDLLGARLNKDGLYSACRTGFALADAALRQGVGRAGLERGMAPVVHWLRRDNFYGETVFRLCRFAFSGPWLSRVLYQAFATELKMQSPHRRTVTRVLWEIAGGTADYGKILRRMISIRAIRSLLVGGALLTLRNRLVEILFGLRWGAYGRYPTVVIREKRDYVKARVERNLGIRLDPSPEFEHMYIIKIRAPAEAIFRELLMFGDPRRAYLRLRFVKIEGVDGPAGRPGYRVRYRTFLPGVSLTMELARVREDRALAFSVEEKLARRGKLIFSVDPTKDGNWSLIVYAAFDYRRGRTPAGRVFWRLFRFLFPAFLHDIFWNHALCRIKERVERNGDT